MKILFFFNSIFLNTETVERNTKHYLTFEQNSGIASLGHCGPFR